MRSRKHLVVVNSGESATHLQGPVDHPLTALVIQSCVSEWKRTEDGVQLLCELQDLLENAKSLDESLKILLEKLGRIGGWALAQAWIPTEKGNLKCHPEWYAGTTGVKNFRIFNQMSQLPAHAGLPRRVWASKEPLWISDLSEEKALSQTIASTRANLKSAMAIPVLAQNQVLAVLEFYGNEVRDNLQILKLSVAAAKQLGTSLHCKTMAAELHRNKEFSFHAATHDSLTSLPNRVQFENFVRAEMECSNYSAESQFAVLFLDLDRFKFINDGLGHAVGDAVIKEVGNRLRGCLRQGDLVARLSGDEFAVLVRNLKGKDGPISAAERIRGALAGPIRLLEHSVFVTASIGIALNDKKYKSPEEMLQDAHTAMNRAKLAGRACSEFFAPAMRDKAIRLLELENGIRRGIERDEFKLHYQPIVNGKSGKIEAFEALVRWYHPEKGIVSPAEFIPIAEETGLIVPLGEMILKEAASQVRTWQQRHHRRIAMSVNISAKQLTAGNFAGMVKSVLEEFQLPGPLLMLEVTEGVLVQDSKIAMNVLSDLKALEVRLLLDDFGTGYSSLNYLHLFPFDTLKIDRTFIDGMSCSPNKAKILKAIVSLAHNLGMDVIAEGVETAEQARALKRLKCRWLQGYFFKKPAPAAEAEQLLQRTSRVRKRVEKHI